MPDTTPSAPTTARCRCPQIAAHQLSSESHIGLLSSASASGDPGPPELVGRLDAEHPAHQTDRMAVALGLDLGRVGAQNGALRDHASVAVAADTASIVKFELR